MLDLFLICSGLSCGAALRLASPGLAAAAAAALTMQPDFLPPPLTASHIPAIILFNEPNSPPYIHAPALVAPQIFIPLSIFYSRNISLTLATGQTSPSYLAALPSQNGYHRDTNLRQSRPGRL